MPTEPDSNVEIDAETIYAFAVTASGEMFLATAQGLKKSGDGGHSWNDVYGDLFAGTEMPTTSLAYLEEAHILFAGVPGGILRSQDGGATWDIVQLQQPAPVIVDIQLSPAFSADQTLFAASAEDGLSCSRDGGKSWQTWNFGLLDANLFSLAVSPHYAANQSVYIGSSSGIFRSTNGGYSWVSLDEMGDRGAVLSLALLGMGSKAEVLLAGFEQGGLVASRDGGKTWTHCAGLPEGAVISALCPDPAANERVFCLDDSGIYRSDDFGENFQRIDEDGAAALFCQPRQLWSVGSAGVKRYFI